MVTALIAAAFAALLTYAIGVRWQVRREITDLRNNIRDLWAENSRLRGLLDKVARCPVCRKMWEDLNG